MFVFTCLSGSIEDFNIFELYTDACPELHSICGVVFAASLNGAISMGPKKNRTRIKQSVNEHSYNMKYCSKQHKD